MCIYRWHVHVHIERKKIVDSLIAYHIIIAQFERIHAKFEGNNMDSSSKNTIETYETQNRKAKREKNIVFFLTSEHIDG